MLARCALAARSQTSALVSSLWLFLSFSFPELDLWRLAVFKDSGCRREMLEEPLQAGCRKKRRRRQMTEREN